MIYTRQGAATSAPPIPARDVGASQSQLAVANPSHHMTTIPQQPAIMLQQQATTMTQVLGAATQPEMGIDVAQIIQQAMQAFVQDTRVIVQEALTAFR